MENIREEELGKVSGGSEIDGDFTNETYVVCKSCNENTVLVISGNRGKCTNRACVKFNEYVTV